MKHSYIQLHVAILLAACSSIFGKLISLDAVFITFYRMLLAAVILFVVVISTRRTSGIGKSARGNILTGVLLALHWIMFYASIKFANVSIGVVCFCLSGFFTALVSPIINRHKFNMSELLQSSLTLIGVLLIFQFDSSFRLGVLCGIISSLLFAIYTSVNSKVCIHGNAVQNTMLQMTGGAVTGSVLLPVYICFSDTVQIFPSLTDFSFLLLLALMCTVCMCLLLNRSQKHLSAFTISLSFNLEPIYSIVIAMVLFHENKVLGSSFYFGLLFIILSLALQYYKKRSPTV